MPIGHQLTQVLASHLLRLRCLVVVPLSETKRQMPSPLAESSRRSKSESLLLQPAMSSQLVTLGHLLSVLAQLTRRRRAARYGLPAVSLACTATQCIRQCEL